MTFFVLCRDLASAIVGPFATLDEAAAHVRFLRARGDADPGRIVDEVRAAELTADMRLTPEQDRAFGGV